MVMEFYFLEKINRSKIVYLQSFYNLYSVNLKSEWIIFRYLYPTILSFSNNLIN